jgi:hypothetical protein
LSVKLPVAYLIPKNAASDSILNRLRMHGIVVETLTSRLDVNGLSFAIDSLVKSGRPFQGHSEVRLEGRWVPNQHVVSEPGNYIVRTSQPLGVLAAMLLEPQSDDGLTTWNFLDVVLDPMMKQPDPDSHNFPIVRITQPVTAPTRIIP